MITPEIYSQLKEANILKPEVDNQYKLLTQGVKYIDLNRAATISNGIGSMPMKEATNYADYYVANRNKTSILKFIPASGAATRMFKELFAFANDGVESDTINILYSSIHKLAFAPLIPQNLTKKDKAIYILKTLGYQSTPKGLIPFHTYAGFTRTPFKEHWIEGLRYASSKNKVDLHFTVSAEHQDAFEKIYITRKKSFSEEYNLELNINFSHQYKSTDTIIVDDKGAILLDENNKPILRPGGHGALIQNLNALETDLVFVKNIDNVSHENHLTTTTLFKKALAGLLLQLKNKVFNQLHSIDKGESKVDKLEVLGKELNISQPANYITWDNESKVEFWKTKFNRPIRVCGMVKNEGAPGGGPFWVNSEKETSLQIVETAQLNLENADQNKILKKSTHFNPVDLVCYITNYQGQKFNLLEYVDESAAFITNKTVQGKEVKVLERPGLWNGAMANWITLFIEVPIETFNPVKTVNDLLKPAHLP